MKEKYVKQSTSEVVFAEKIKLSHKRTRAKKNSYEDQFDNFHCWLIEHADGFISKLSDAKFTKRYVKA